MAMASEKVAMNGDVDEQDNRNLVALPGQVVIKKQIPDDVVLSIFTCEEKLVRFPLNTERKENFNAFYDSLRSHKYGVPEGLPLRGMLIAVHRNGAWHPAIVVEDVFRNARNGQLVCHVVLTDSNECKENVRVEECRLLPQQFSVVFPPMLVEDKYSNRIICHCRTLPQEEEYIDYDACIPWQDIVPMDYKFPRVPLLKPAVDRKLTAAAAGTAFQSAVDALTLKLQIMVSKSPSDFSFMLKRDEEAFVDLNKKLDQIYIHEMTDPYLVPSELVVEKLPVVVETTASSWLRAYVLQDIDEDVCVVQPVDTGSPFEVYKKHLRFVHKSLAEVPAFGYRGKLAGVVPYGQTWSDDAKTAFNQMASVGIRCIVGMVQYITDDGVAGMHLWNKDKNKEEFWIGDEMVRRLAARKDNVPFDKLPNRALPDQDPDAAVLAECMASMSMGGTSK